MGWSYKLTITKLNGNKSYSINKFVSVSIPIDLDQDSNEFTVEISNQNGVNFGVASRLDKATLYVNGKCVMRGIIDQVDYSCDDSGSVIRISGRDRRAYMISNDRVPCNKKTVNPKTYIKGRAKAFGIKFHAYNTPPKYKKLKVSTGQSEYSVCDTLLEDTQYRLWYLVDTLFLGKWSTGAKYKFHIGSISNTSFSLKIKNAKFMEKVEGVYSAVKVYNTNKKGNFKLKKTQKCKYLSKYTKRTECTKLSGEASSASRYKAKASRDMLDGLRDSMELEMTLGAVNSGIFMPNVVCCVHIPEIFGTKPDYSGTRGGLLWFIRKVEYKYSDRDGSECVLTCIPADDLLNKIYTGKIVL